MGICATELRDYVIRPTLKHLGIKADQAELQLLTTAACESALGNHIKQKKRRGLGIYQIDPLTHHHLWDKYLAFRPELASKVRGLASQREFLAHPHTELATNLAYSTAIAACLYLKVDENWSESRSDEQMSKLWKQAFHSGRKTDIGTFKAHLGKLKADLQGMSLAH